MSSSTARALMQLLAAAGGWVGRAQIERQLTLDTTRLDDELVLLVSAGAVRLNPRGEQYCLTGSPMARKALQRLVARPPEHRRELLMAPTADGEHMRVALALRCPAAAGQADEPPELVMAEWELPHHKGDPDKAQALATFFAKLGGALEAPVVAPVAQAAEATA